MGVVVALLVLAVIAGIIGLVVRALKWLLLLAIALFVVGLVRGAMAKGRTRA